MTNLVDLSMHESSSTGTGISEASFPNKKNKTGGDYDNKEMVQVLQVQIDGGRDLPLVDDHDGMYDKPLSCFGCGIGWFSFLLGFAFPPLWYYATVLYFGNFLKDPRERPGLAASAIAALICSVVVFVTLLLVFC